MYRLEIGSLARSAGRRATAAAAYRSGERIRDAQSGELFNYSRRQDVVHKEIFLPAHLQDSNLEWAKDRTKLWNSAEQAEKRRDSRVAREYQVALPPELGPTERVALARRFSRELSDRYNVAVDLAVHDPRPGSDPRNFHAHLLTTTREVTP
jgi:ATP-dependent exoDNAse (exonuclease V) alpha subunit